jgi:hypothetical protein
MMIIKKAFSILLVCCMFMSCVQAFAFDLTSIDLTNKEIV